jgi:hypothetical protein
MRRHYNRCLGDNPEDPLNKRFFYGIPLSVIPLLDMPNHLQPENLDISDAVSFKFNVVERYDYTGKYASIAHSHAEKSPKKTSVLTFPAQASYHAADEFIYTYCNRLQAH